jgi:hypothetical protein
VTRQHDYSPTKGEVLGTTEARQANSRKMNLRVLIVSTALIIAIFAAFVIAFLYQTSPRMDGTDQARIGGPPTNSVPQER